VVLPLARGEVERVIDERGVELRVRRQRFLQSAAWHALVQKSVAKRYALEHGREYEDLNLIVAHLGLGTSVGAHRRGRCVKVRNSLFDGPMALERAGTLPGGALHALRGIEPIRDYRPLRDRL